MTIATTAAQSSSGLATASAWAQTHGLLWSAETMHTDTQEPFLALVTPSSEDGLPSWLIHREASGVVLATPDGQTYATAATLEDALAAVERAEQEHALEVGMTGAELDAAEAWAAGLGAGWSVEPNCADDGRISLGVFSPHRWDESQDVETYSFIVSRSSEGVALLETRSFSELGVFASVATALNRARDVATAG
jgi:hypothetical protein